MSILTKVIPVRRLAASAGTLALVLTLAACGDDTGEAGSGLDSVTITGDFDKSVKVKWDGELQVDAMEEETVIEGDGAKVDDGDTALVKFWIGNGFTQKEAYSSFVEGGKAESITLGKDLSKAIREAILDHTVGSRVAVAAPPADAFGESGNPQLGIGNADPVLFVVDIIGSVLKGPEGEDQKVPAGTPAIQGGDTPTGFDFSKSPKKPSGKLEVVTVVKGSGATVEKGQQITINYLGQIYGSKKIFDQSYSKGQPATFGIGLGQLIPGWDKGLVGVPVGSRLILVIPPNDGYGTTGNAQAGIKGTDTLVFVVDVLAAS